MKLMAALLACLLPFAVLAQASPAGSPPEVEIQTVIEAFRTAIIDKDKERFVGLFLPGHVAWQSVRGDDTVRRAREKDPNATKVLVNPEKTHLSFIDGIVDSKNRIEEKFRNTRIETDGDIASVYFDYSFHANDVETNHGQEAWQLVRTGDGWRISAVAWSVNRTPPQS
jgi:hypothetical protein